MNDKKLKSFIKMMVSRSKDSTNTSQVLKAVSEKFELNPTSHLRKKITSILNTLAVEGYLEKRGRARSIRYYLNKSSVEHMAGEELGKAFLSGFSAYLKGQEKEPSKIKVEDFLEFTKTDLFRNSFSNSSFKSMMHHLVKYDGFAKPDFQRDIVVNHYDLDILDDSLFSGLSEKKWFVDKVKEEISPELIVGIEKYVEDFSYINNKMRLMAGGSAFIQWVVERHTKSFMAFIRGKSRKKDKKGFGFFVEDLGKKYFEFRKPFFDLPKPFESTSRLISIFSDKGVLTPLKVNSLYSSDFDSIGNWGQTRLGHLIRLAKLGNRNAPIITEEICKLTRNDIESLIKQNQIDLVVWTPHTVDRTYPFLGEYRKALGIKVKQIKAIKTNESALAQKTMPNFNARLKNAKESLGLNPNDNMIIESSRTALIIDDSVGSGATVNQIAIELKNVNPKLDCIVYSVTGSSKGFEYEDRNEV